MLQTLIALSLLGLTGPLLAQATHTVPDDFATIQGAISSPTVMPGDTVLVRPDSVNGGPYYERLDFGGKDVQLESVAGAALTTIDAQSAGSVVTFNSGESSAARIEGFTITGGLSGAGGGIFISSGASPAVVGNVISGNEATDIGGGIFVNSGAAIVTGNTIVDNHAWEGGGVFVAPSAMMQIVDDNVVRSNSAIKGGGLFVLASSNPLHQPSLSGNVIVDNSAIGAGGGIYSHGHITVRRSEVSRNSACCGGGIHFAATNGGLESCVVADNTAVNRGGGLDCMTGLGLTIHHCTFAGNQVTSLQGAVGGAVVVPSGWHDAVVRNCIFWGNVTAGGGSVVYPANLPNLFQSCSLQSYPQGGPSNLIADPLFVDAANGDYHLSSRSPCINRGSPTSTIVDDIDGDSRPQMGTVDIGADEFSGVHALASGSFSLQEPVGGQVQLSLDAGIAEAGRTYVIFGSASGSIPGMALPGGLVTLPIAPDLLTDVVLANLNTPSFVSFLGTLDSQGRASAVMDTLGPLPSGAAGTTLTFAYLLNGPFDMVSNPIHILVQ